MSEGTARGCRLSLSDFRQTYAAVQRAVTSLEKPRTPCRLAAEAEPSPSPPPPAAPPPRARRQTHGPPSDGWSPAIAGESSLAVANRALFALPPPRRSHAQLAMLRAICALHAAPFFGSLSAAQQREFVRACALRQCACGEVLCEPSEHADAFHLLAAGEVILKEPQLHHRMTSHERKPPWVTRTIGPGEHFGHFPLVTGASRCGYAAQVAPPTAADQSNEPAILLFLRREDYEAIIKPELEALLRQSVAQLRGTDFFSIWSETALQRLFFSFKQIHVSPDEDVMVQGDAADCCYVIQSGECDVLMRSEPPRDAPAADSDAAAPSPAASFRKKPALAALISAQIAQMKSKTTDEQPAQEEAAPLQPYRAVARLGAGQLVGEIALLNPGTTRGATVRAVGAVSLLRLDRSAFARLDPRTLAALADHSLGRVLRNTFQRVCAKPPHLRTEEDLDLLVSNLSQDLPPSLLPAPFFSPRVLHSSGLPPAWHKVICRVMTYLKFGEGEVLARCGDPAAAMYILTVGTVRVSDPSGTSVRSIGPGGCFGHEELLLHASRFASTALVCESLAEAMHISRADFDDFLRHPFSVLPSDPTASFLRTCPSLRTASPPAVQQLARAAQRKRFARASHCLFYPPPQRTARVLHASPAVSPSSFFETGFVYFVSQGEATLFCDQYIGEHPAQPTSRDLCKRPHYGRNHLGLPLGLPKYSPAPPSPRPHSARPSSAAAPRPTTPKAQRRFLPVATYAEKEVLIEELFNCGGSCSWYLLPTTSWFEVIAVPRKAWQEAISPSALADVRKLTFQRAVLYEELMYRACLAQQRRIRTLQLGT